MHGLVVLDHIILRVVGKDGAWALRAKVTAARADDFAQQLQRLLVAGMGVVPESIHVRVEGNFTALA